MAHDGQDVMREPGLLLDDLLGLTGAALPVVDAVLDQARQSVRAMVEEDGRVSARLIDTHQTAAHGLAWLATYAEALRQMQGWAERLQAQGSFGEVEALIHQIAFGEYLNQIAGGIQMNQGEVIRLADLGLGAGASAGLQSGAAATLAARGNTQAVRSRLVELMQERAAEITVGRCGLDDELEMIREQFRRYAVDRIEPHAHDWHLKDDYIPLEVIDELAEMVLELIGKKSASGKRAA